MYNSSAEKSWVTLYLDNRSQIEQFFRQRIDNVEDCRDLEQELFIRIHKLDPEKAVQDRRAYLFKIALNLVNDLLRWRQRHAHPAADIPDLETVQDDTYQADDQVADRQRLQILKEAIAELPPKCREVFLLRKLEDLPSREIAERLGISQNMVEKHLRKALGMLREYMARQEEERL